MMKSLTRSHFRNGLCAVPAMFLGAATLNSAVIPTPIWFGDPNTTFQSYTFTTSSLTPAPETVTNPYGAPAMDITVDFTGTVGTGYQDPSEPTEIHRVDGAWDLGPGGSIELDIPVAPTPGPGESYIVDVYVAVVYEATVGFYNLPDVLFTPSSIASTSVDPAFELEGGVFPWGLLISETTIGATPSELISVLVDATGATGSLVDTVEVHTRYTLVPEPSVYALVFGCGVFAWILFRRSRGLR